MAGSINKVILIGRLGRDPEMRFTPAGKAVTNFTMATSETWKDDSGERQERTEWHRVKFFGRLAEIAGEYLRKGQQVYIEGSIRTDKVEGKDGQTRYFTDIIANNMQMLGGPGEGASRGEGGGYRQRPQQGRPGAAASGGDSARQSAPPPQDAGGFEDDDIPF